MAEITFRKTPREGDEKLVRKIMESTGFFEAVFDELDSGEAEMREIIASPNGEQKAVFIETDGVAQGFCIFGRECCCDALIYISWICVNNALRGHGLGRKLVGEVLADCWKAGARKVLLQTSGRPQYLPTRAFYEKLGFRKEAEIADYYTEGETSVFYSIYNPARKG